LCHATGSRHIAHGGQKDIGIWIFQCGGDVLRNGFFILELVSRMEGGKLGHVFSPYQ
jgi:hypothetical protein